MKLSSLWCRSTSFLRSQLSAYVFSMLTSAIRANAIVKHVSFNKDVISDALLAVTMIVIRFFPAWNQRPCLISARSNERTYRDATGASLVLTRTRNHSGG